jgi:hypothetical protein
LNEIPAANFAVVKVSAYALNGCRRLSTVCRYASNDTRHALNGCRRLSTVCRRLLNVSRHLSTVCRRLLNGCRRLSTVCRHASNVSRHASNVSLKELKTLHFTTRIVLELPQPQLRCWLITLRTGMWLMLLIVQGYWGGINPPVHQIGVVFVPVVAV